MAEASLWAKALKGTADLGTVIGNGLLLGRGEDVKSLAGFGVGNAARAIGLMGGDYVPLKDYMEQGANELAAARQGAGVAGAIAEPVAGVASGFGLAKGAVAGARALPAVAGAALKAAPSIGKALGAIGLGGVAYNMAGRNSEPEDFAPNADTASSSATTGAQPGSKQVGAAASEAAPAAGGQADWSPSKKAFVNLMTSVPLPKLEAAMKVGTMGATKPLTPRDLAFQQLTGMLQQQYSADAQTDPDKARMNYMRGLGALLQPSGVMYMPNGSDE